MDRRITALSFAVSLLFLTSTAFATDRLVPSVYPTIQEVINAAAVGDTVVITNLPGTAQARSVYAITDRNSKVNARTMISEQKPLTIYGPSNFAGIVVDQTKQKTTKRVIFLFNSRQLSDIIKNWSG